MTDIATPSAVCLAEDRLRQGLSSKEVYNAYAKAVAKGIKSARAAWGDEFPDDQLRWARKVARKELVAQLGWDLE